MTRILIADDDRTAALTLAALFRRSGYQTQAVHDGKSAIEALERTHFEIVITDLRMPQIDGLGVVRAIHERWPETAVIVVTGHGSVEAAVEAMRFGAVDFVTKPLDIEALRLRVGNVLKQQEMAQQVERLSARIADYEAIAGPGGIVGQSAGMQQVLQATAQVAPTEANVLILGESGTGKELLARAIHEQSARADGPFIQVHCAAYAEGILESELFGHERGAFTGAVSRKLGRFELAEGGTFFLDEVGDIPLATQIKLLRVIQERRFERVGGTQEITADIRIVAATNRDLPAAIASGAFREDLFYRLNVFTLELPPLRDRRDDIPALVQTFLRRESKRLGHPIRGVDSAAMAALSSWQWPGNIRELQNVIQRAAILCGPGPITLAHLPATLRERPVTVAPLPPGGLDFDGALADFERQLIQQAYDQAGGVKAQAARLLGIDRNRLRYKLEKLGITD